jgi:hypothetical protein
VIEARSCVETRESGTGQRCVSVTVAGGDSGPTGIEHEVSEAVMKLV